MKKGKCGSNENKAKEHMKSRKECLTKSKEREVKKTILDTFHKEPDKHDKREACQVSRGKIKKNGCVLVSGVGGDACKDKRAGQD